MSGIAGGSGNDARPALSGSSGDVLHGNQEPVIPTGNAIVDTAAILGPRGVMYDEEYKKLRDFLQRTGNVLGPAAPVIVVNIARKLYVKAKQIVADRALLPYNKCVFLFQIFDAMVLVYKNLSFVYCDSDGTRSVYGYSDFALKNLLSRIEAMTRQVAVAVHDAYSLTALNKIVATAEQRLSQVQTEQDMLEFFRSVSGGSPSNGITTPSGGGGGGGGGAQLPRGIELYRDPYPEVAALVERLYATNSDKNYIRDFHDCMFLVATGNSPVSLSSALETRLADKDRNIVLFEATGDRLFASTMCASAIGYLRRKLRASSGVDGRSNGGSSGGIETYRINYGRIFSKYRGESERNFDGMMEWIKHKVRASDTFRVFWFPDIENLMSPRTSNDQEHIATIKNSMLQHMDVFNKDRTLRSFLLLFNSSEGLLDSAFARRLETVIKTPVDPLTDVSVATQVVGAELAHYHINLTDELAARVAVRAGSFNEQNSRVGGFAYVQATLRDIYVNQKLALSHNVRAIETQILSSETLGTLLGRYMANSSRDTTYDLDERPVSISTVSTIAFSPASRLATRFGGESSSIKYNASVRGDPKNIDERSAARTLFLHDI